LDALKNDKALLTQSLTALQTTLQDLQARYQALVEASAQLESDYKALQTAYQEQTSTLTQLQASFKAYQKSVQSQKTKSLILEVVLVLIAAGWGLDAIGVF
jgi:chromosome segregation ATPase